jgi:hypothetical protein
LPVDREPNLAVLNDPPLAGIGVHPLRRFLSRRHRNVIAVQRLVVDNRLGPVGCAFVFGKKIGQFGMRLVRTRPAAGLDSFGRPDALLHRAGSTPAGATLRRLRCRRARLLRRK